MIKYVCQLWQCRVCVCFGRPWSSITNDKLVRLSIASSLCRPSSSTWSFIIVRHRDHRVLGSLLHSNEMICINRCGSYTCDRRPQSERIVRHTTMRETFGSNIFQGIDFGVRVAKSLLPVRLRLARLVIDCWMCAHRKMKIKSIHVSRIECMALTLVCEFVCVCEYYVVSSLLFFVVRCDIFYGLERVMRDENQTTKR